APKGPAHLAPSSYVRVNNRCCSAKVRLSERQRQRLLPITPVFSERLLRAERKRGASRRIATWKVAWQPGTCNSQVSSRVRYAKQSIRKDPGFRHFGVS